MSAKLRSLIPVVTLVSTIGIFILDLATPLGLAVPLLYFIPLWLTLWIPCCRSTLALASLQGGLILVGFWFSPPGPIDLAMANRLMTVGVLAVSVLLLVRLKKSQMWITEQKGVEVGLRTQAETCHSLMEAMVRLTSEPEMEPLFRGILETATRLTGARYGALGIFDESGRRMTRFVTIGMDEATQRAIGSLPTNRGLLGAVKVSDGVIRLRDLTRHPAFTGFPPNHPPMRSLMGTTLHAYGRHFGWLYLTEKEGAEEFTELDEQILAALAVHAAAVLENARRLEQLLHAEKLGAVGKLSASIAHEFNNPIYGIRNVLEQLVDRDGGDPRMADLLKLAVGECNRMADLVKNLGDFYRPSSGNWIPTSLHCILEDTLRLMEGKFQTRGIRLAREYAAEMPMIGTIPDQIRQVILNLLMNAEEAIQGEDRRITIGTEVSGTAVVLRIQDTGGGIAPEHVGKIFEPFFTTKSEVKGSGLGLSVSYGIIKRHGGDIRLESEPGKGTTVTVTLPVHPPAEERTS